MMINDVSLLFGLSRIEITNNLNLISSSAGRELLGVQLGRERTLQDPKGNERVRD